MTTGLERALAELVAGHDYGWSLWEAALCELERVIADSRAGGETRFLSYAPGELDRLLRAVDVALRRAAFAVDLRQAFAGDADTASETSFRDRIEELLLERARQISADRVA